MSYKLVDQVYSLKLTRPEQAVLVCVCRRAGDDGTGAHPSADTIAWELDYDERHVRRLLNQLESAGILVAVAYGKGGAGRATEWEVHLEMGIPKDPVLKKQPRKADIQIAALYKEECPPNPDITTTKADIQIADQRSYDPSIRSTFKKEDGRERVDRGNTPRVAPPPPTPSFASSRASPPPAATPFPADFTLTPERRRVAEREVASKGVGYDVDTAFRKFVGHFTRGKGRGAREPDWDWRWEKWVLEDVQKAAASTNGKANGNGHGKAQGGYDNATAGKSKRALAIEQRWRERTGTELDEISFGGVPVEAPSDHGRLGPGRGPPPGRP